MRWIDTHCYFCGEEYVQGETEMTHLCSEWDAMHYSPSDTTKEEAMTTPTRIDKIDGLGYHGAERLTVTFEGPGAGFTDAPAIEGWKAFFIGRHGSDKVVHTYRRVPKEQA